MQDINEIRRVTRAQRVQFINIELDLAITFVTIAFEGGLDGEKTERNQRYARMAYGSATRLLKNTDLSPAEASEIESKLHRIKAAWQGIDNAA